ncbi:ABC transporter permease [Clostridium culturomicium]|uniref:ABC transporter permease n=1 Tax=Clostridium culturomicium TaxID=1499683 RepID=UPI00058CE344|nr:FtsX-like permease family protein [Clostridium culturomicium]
MSSFMYPRLAWQNIKKNEKFYLPYILTIVGASAAFYILLAMNGAKDLPENIRYSYLANFIFFGTIVIGIFSVIFLFYTNSFLMKRRNKELGMYNILGMDKRHIGKVLVFESIYTALIGIGGGIIIGIVFQKLVTLLLYKLMKFDVPFGFYIFYEGIGITFIFFTVILTVALLFNLRRIHVQNPIELLRGGQVGEREPKTKWIIAILGVICLGGGYYLAVSTSNAMDALAMYFVAVILVIIGTYCLFTAVSIVILKVLRKNKKFYYKTTNFIGISGMIYRMKRNAVGLANICILSTMVLVMVSGTLALYLGTEDSINFRYPGDINIETRYRKEENLLNVEQLQSRITSGIEKQGYKMTKVNTLNSLSFIVGDTNNGFITDRNKFSNMGSRMLVFITASEYGRLLDIDPPKLEDDEILLYSQGRPAKGDISIDFSNADNPEGKVRTFKVKEELDSFPAVSDYAAFLLDISYCVVADASVMFNLSNEQTQAYGDYASPMIWEAHIDLDGTTEEKIACADFISNPENINVDGGAVGSWEWYSVESKDSNSIDFYSLNGGFFFLGIFLGLLFIMATVLIIYYKQISEGYEDRERFQIMQKVGLDKKDIKRSINSQVLIVFFMPLIVASVHIVFNFRLMKMLLTLFGLTNTTLTFYCTIGTVLAFMAAYSIVYMLTAKVYYKIVSK